MKRCSFLLCLIGLPIAFPAFSKTDTTTINRWNEQALNMAYSRPDKALELAEKALSEARKIGFSRGQVRALIRMGIVYDVKSDNAQAIASYQKSLVLSRKTNDLKGEASNLNNLGLICWKMNRLDGAVTYLNEAYTIFKRLEDEQNLASVSNNIGLIYEEQVRSERALSWHRKALRHAVIAKDNYMIYDIYSNIGIAYESLGKADSAEWYTLRAIEGYRLTNNLYGLGIALSNLGMSLTSQGESARAVPFLEESMQIARQLGHQASYVSSGSNLATALRKLGRYERETEVLEEVYPIAQKVGSKELLYKISYYLGESYFRRGKFTQGREMMERFRDYHFAYYKEMLNRNIAEAEKKFEVRRERERNKLERQRAALRLKRQSEARFVDNLLWTASLAVLLLAALLVFFIVRKRSLQQQLASQKAVFDATTEERRRISYDLHDHVGSQLSYVVNNLELLRHMEAGNERIGRTFAMSQAAMSSLRDTVWALHTEELTLQSLAERMENVARKTLESTENVRLVFDNRITATSIIPQQTTMHVMRIFQEAVHNVVKHAQATELTITVTESGNTLRAEVADNGVGIAEDPQKPFHYGLQSMKERAAKIGGSLEITNGQNGGTSVVLIWPKNNPNA
jgi:signal transduction histidine kinase/Tfp pilus assembly protein PilF